MTENLHPNIQGDIEKVVNLEDFRDRVIALARREVQLRHAKEIAKLIHFNDLTVEMCEVNTQPWELRPEESQCALCLGPLVQEKAYFWWWGEGRGYSEFAHIICVGLAKADGVTLAPIDFFTGKRSAQDDYWAHNIQKCDEFCVWCREDGA